MTVGLGLLTAFSLSMKSAYSRALFNVLHYGPIELGTDSMMLFGLSLLPFFINYQLTIGYTGLELFYGITGSMLSCSANILLTNASVRGMGGPVSALVHF